MASKKNLQNIAYGMCTRFSSRYNAWMGYWYLGFLRSAADQADSRTVTIDVLGQKIAPIAVAADSKLIELQYELRQRLAHHDIDMVIVSAVSIEIEFGVVPPAHYSPTSWRGDATAISMTIRDDLGKLYRVTVFATCAPHDPSCESASGAG